jgi:hypothetical protein
MRLMRKYKDSPDWWYLVLFLIMVGLSFAVCTAWPTGFPAWAYIICITIPVIWVCCLLWPLRPFPPHSLTKVPQTIPIGIIQAITNIQIGLNVLTEFVVGYLLPGHPLAMMVRRDPRDSS